MMTQQLHFPVKAHSVRPLFPLCPACVGGCQSGFMSSSLELKEVSIVSCYERRPCLPFRVNDVRGDSRGATASSRRFTEATKTARKSMPHCVSSSPATCLVIIPSVCWRLGSVSQTGWQWSTTPSTKINFFTNHCLVEGNSKRHRWNYDRN